jgi:phenylalanine-4-hydroxylase
VTVNQALASIRKTGALSTVELDSGIAISGKLGNALKYTKPRHALPDYLQFSGPTQLSLRGTEIANQGVEAHSAGFGFAMGRLNGSSENLSELSDEGLLNHGIQKAKETTLEFASGVVVRGTLDATMRGPDGKLVLLSFSNCKVTAPDGKILFDPSWGAYDLAVGSSITKISSGVADPKAYLKGLPE